MADSLWNSWNFFLTYPLGYDTMGYRKGGNGNV